MKMSILVTIIASLFASSVFASSQNWNLNDVSYLYKIPKAQSENTSSLLVPMSAGVKGELLPMKIFKMLPPVLNGGTSNYVMYHQALKVVSVRIDPCPNGDKKCKPEVRLVWQPVEYDSYENKWTTRDGAVHTFYRVSKMQWTVLKAGLWRLKLNNVKKGVDTTKMPLGVHPAFLSKKTEAQFTKDLNELLLTICGEKNLYKTTFMSLLVPTRWWRFGSFEKDRLRGWISTDIPRLNHKMEDLFNTAMEPGHSTDIEAVGMDAMINIIPTDYPKEDLLFNIISATYRFEDERDLPQFKATLPAAHRFRNPYKTNGSNLNCASCHFADAAMTYAERRFPELKKFTSQDMYVNPNKYLFDLTNNTVAPKSSRIVRSFGYFTDLPAINQRVINDSAESALGMSK